MAVDNQGLFLSTTMIIPEEQEELRLKLYQYFSDISNATNNKDTGYYFLNEFVNGQTFFPNPTFTPTNNNYQVNRAVFRTVVDFGALPNTATKSVAHGITITNTFSFTRIYATASNQTGLVFFPIPGNGCNITVDATNVNITTTANMTAYTKCYVVLEYLKF